MFSNPTNGGGRCLRGAWEEEEEAGAGAAVVRLEAAKGGGWCLRGAHEEDTAAAKGGGRCVCAPGSTSLALVDRKAAAQRWKHGDGGEGGCW